MSRRRDDCVEKKYYSVDDDEAKSKAKTLSCTEFGAAPKRSPAFCAVKGRRAAKIKGHKEMDV